MLWRLAAAIGGAGGLASLALPYAHVTSGTLGLSVSEESYTLFGLAQLLADAGKDPQMVYLLALVIGVASALALVGAVTSSWLAAIGGLLQGLAAGAFAYSATGTRTFLFGLGQAEVTLETGLFVLAAASVITLACLPLRTLTATLASSPSEA